VLVVENTLVDARFKDNALVAGPPHIRFYAGCPLIASNKARLGSL
jgi:GAF domain-containing protein